MAVTSITVEDFIEMAQTYLVVDVRSPKEYKHAHFPSALSVPLFSDEERKVVGTTYKQKSRKKAIKTGLDYFGPKMKVLVNQVEEKLHHRDQNTVLVHCWRGGMRSSAIAWLLDLYGFKVYTLEGGYKRFRNWALEQFKKRYPLRILGGYTGSGKTEILLELRAQHRAVIDLEGVARHKGSSFGNLEEHPQPSTEQFENILALQLHYLCNTSFKDPTIWVESESSRVGKVNVPHQFFNQMKTAERVNIEVPFEKRLAFIVQEYGQYDRTALIAATKRIKKRLGGLRMQQTIDYLKREDLKSAFAILLGYYDNAYTKSRKRFQTAEATVHLPNTDHRANALKLLKEITPPVSD